MDGSCCVVRDGKLLSYIATERLTRNKFERGITQQSIKYVTDKANITLDDIDLVAICSWFSDRDMYQRELFDKNKNEISLTNENGIEYSFDDYIKFYSDPTVASGLFNFNVKDKTIKAFHVDHHFAHSFYSYYMSPFKETISFSLDYSDNISANHSIYYFNDDLKIFRQLRKGNDLFYGSYYGQICDTLGFYPSLAKAGTMMALAAYGKPSTKLVDRCSYLNLVPPITRDLYLETLLDAGIKKIPDMRILYPQLKKEGGKIDEFWLKKEDWNNELNKNIAATAQSILENSIINFINELYESVHKVSTNLCLSGGIFLNCVMNGHILEKTKFDNIFIAPACGDEGLSIGSALFICDRLKKVKNELVTNETHKVTHSMKEIYDGGKTYIEEDIKDLISKNKNKFNKIEISKHRDENELCEYVSNQLSIGKLISWFQNGSEMGPRALGNRSILADPRDVKMKDYINKEIKFREEFRPFSPSILKEYVNDWFESKKDIDSPFMLFNFKCKKPELIPAVLHIDQTARIQTVTKDNGIYYKLINSFHKLTGIPILLNTSFNGKDEPIVETPEDALKMFLESKIDILVIQNYVFEKNK